MSMFQSRDSVIYRSIAIKEYRITIWNKQIVFSSTCRHHYLFFNLNISFIHEKKKINK